MRCGIGPQPLRREFQRLAKVAAAEAAAQAEAVAYEGDAERAFAQGMASFVAKQAKRLTQWEADAGR
ncbi:MAG TPA: hypothetical protein VN201_10950 [Roseateles sp.]|nr:hypothetical protein [Roseateles sp.]